MFTNPSPTASLTIYGSPMSSGLRCHLLLSYIGVDYQTKTLKMQEGEHKSETFLKLNPNGKVPALVEIDEDGQEFVLFESFAINQYLALKLKPELLGETLQDQGLVAQWSYWGAMEAQTPINGVMYNHRFGSNDPEIEKTQREKSAKVIAILEKHLEGKNFLLGDVLTLADLNLMPIFAVAGSYKMLDESPNIQKWMGGLSAIPAIGEVLAKLSM